MNIVDWHTDPTTREVIREMIIVIEDPGIKQWQEVAEVHSFKIDGTMEFYLPYDFAETSRGVLGYFCWGINEIGFSAKPAWLDGQFINWQRTHVIAPNNIKSFRLWLRRGVKAKVLVHTEDPWGVAGAVFDAAGKKIFEMFPKP